MKKWFAGFLAIVMAFVLQPIAVLAENAQTVYVGGVQLTTGKYLVNGDTSASDSAPTSGTGYAYFDNSTGTAILTLNNATINSAYIWIDGEHMGDKAGICSSGDLMIKLIGTNTINGVAAMENQDSFGIYVEGNLTIEDEATDNTIGSLQVSGGDSTSQSMSIGIGSSNAIIINSGSITAIGNTALSGSFGISTSDFTVEGGRVMSTGGTVNSVEGKSSGIVGNSFQISGGTVVGKTSSDTDYSSAFGVSPNLDDYIGGYQWRLSNEESYAQSTSTSFPIENISAYAEITGIPYNIWVGDVQVTSGNVKGITGNGITGLVTYDNATSTLTLNNATITGTHPFQDYNLYEAVTGIYTEGNLTIKLIGNNSVTGVITGSVENGYGIYVSNGTLKIQDDTTDTTVGSLIASDSGSSTRYSSTGIFAYGGITINSGKVIAAGKTASSYTYGMITRNGDVTIGGTADVTAVLTSDNSVTVGVAIFVPDSYSINVNNGTLVADATGITATGGTFAFYYKLNVSEYINYRWRTTKDGNWTNSITAGYSYGETSYPVYLEILPYNISPVSEFSSSADFTFTLQPSTTVYNAPAFHGGVVWQKHKEFAADEVLKVNTISAGTVYNEMNGIAGGLNIVTQFDLSLKNGIKMSGSSVNINFALGDNYAGKDMSLIHKKADGSYELFNSTADSTGNADFGPITELSPFMLVEGTITQLPTNQNTDDYINPNTGDNTRMGMWIGITIISLLAIVGLGWFLHKHKQDK